MAIIRILFLLCAACLVVPSVKGVDADAAPSSEEELVDVYIIPISDVIATPNLYILRRGLKEAIANDVDMVILDMDTPGGRLDITLDMMEMLDRFDG
ncbi:MAG: membrane-bound serine protease (ClpP class), partial [Lentimonas sp.]